MFYKRVFSGERARANFRAIPKLEALTDITVSLPRMNYTKRSQQTPHSDTKLSPQKNFSFYARYYLNGLIGSARRAHKTHSSTVALNPIYRVLRGQAAFAFLCQMAGV